MPTSSFQALCHRLGKRRSLEIRRPQAQENQLGQAIAYHLGQQVENLLGRGTSKRKIQSPGDHYIGLLNQLVGLKWLQSRETMNQFRLATQLVIYLYHLGGLF